MPKTSGETSFDKAISDLANSPIFWSFMEPIILNMRSGLLGRQVGYRTRVTKQVKVRVRTPKYSKNVPIDWSLGGEFGDAHYRDIMVKLYLNPYVGCMYYDLKSHLDSVFHKGKDRSWRGVHRHNWWHEAALVVVHREVGNNARWFCEQVFVAAKTARDDPKAADVVKQKDRSQCVRTLRNAIRGALDAGVTKREISKAVDVAIVESVMDG